MKEPNWSTCTEEELWKYIASHLAKCGIDTLLVGGAVVAIYTEGAYHSGDLDFVLLSLFQDKLPATMAKIGFKVTQSCHYSHPKCRHLIVDFVSGPPGIGDDHRITPAEIKSDGQIIKLYSPTDCIRDRLASFIHFNARECLDQAVMVARRYPFNKTKVRAWCRKEASPHAYEELEKMLAAP